MDMDIDTPRERSFSSSENNSRKSSTHSNTSSVPYHERMENFNTFWSEQVENDEKERLSLSYATPRVEEGNMVNEAINTSLNEGGDHRITMRHLPLTTCHVHKEEVRQTMLLTHVIPRSSQMFQPHMMILINQLNQMLGMGKLIPFLFLILWNFSKLTPRICQLCYYTWSTLSGIEM